MPTPPTIALTTDEMLGLRLRSALEVRGYHTLSAQPAEVADETTLRAFITRQELDAVVYDAHASAASLPAFQQL